MIMAKVIKEESGSAMNLGLVLRFSLHKNSIGQNLKLWFLCIEKNKGLVWLGKKRAMKFGRRICTEH